MLATRVATYPSIYSRLSCLFVPRVQHVQLRYGHSKTFTQQECDEILRLRNEGLTFVKIAASLGKSASGVSGRYRLQTRGKPQRFTSGDHARSRLSDQERDHIVRRVLEAATWREIALELQRPKASVIQHYIKERLFTLDPSLPPPSLVIPDFDPELGRDIVARFEKGETIKDIGPRLGLNLTKVAFYLAAFEVPQRRNKQYSKDECRQIVELRLAGSKFSQIAEQLGRPGLGSGLRTKFYQLCPRAVELKQKQKRPAKQPRWTSIELERLNRMCEAGLSYREMAVRLSRTVPAVAYRVRKLSALDLSRWSSSKLDTKVHQSPSLKDPAIIAGQDRKGYPVIQESGS